MFFHKKSQSNLEMMSYCKMKKECSFKEFEDLLIVVLFQGKIQHFEKKGEPLILGISIINNKHGARFNISIINNKNSGQLYLPIISNTYWAYNNAQICVLCWYLSYCIEKMYWHYLNVLFILHHILNITVHYIQNSISIYADDIIIWLDCSWAEWTSSVVETWL
jgi:hypothetical protein